MIAECRNIARAHYAIKNGQWRKTFVNSDWVPSSERKSWASSGSATSAA
jgi:D-3-phosphoglycerate dehydrogenase